VAITFGSKAGKEVAKRRPALVLSPLAHNKSGQAIFLPVNTSIYGGTEEVSYAKRPAWALLGFEGVGGQGNRMNVF